MIKQGSYIYRFVRQKRGFIAFCLLSFLFVLSLFSEAIAGSKPIVIYYQDRFFFPIWQFYSGTIFGQPQQEQADYPRLLQQKSFQDEAYWLSPLYPFGPYESHLNEAGIPPHLPNSRHWLGTDRTARDILARILYGFRICMLFSLFLTITVSFLGTIIGALQGILAGRFDFFGQRIIEVWASLPFLYIVILLGNIYGNNFFLLAGIMAAFSWIGLSYYVRAEFYRVKELNFIKNARMLNYSFARIFLRHYVPNTLTPLLTFFPFLIMGGITSLTALDFLGFGLPPPTPSWGELLAQGLTVIKEFPHLIIFTTLALFIILMLFAVVAEALRNTIDPHSR